MSTPTEGVTLEEAVLRALGNRCLCEAPETCDMCEWLSDVARDLAPKLEAALTVAYLEGHEDGVRELTAQPSTGIGMGILKLGAGTGDTDDGVI